MKILTPSRPHPFLLTMATCTCDVSCLMSEVVFLHIPLMPLFFVDHIAISHTLYQSSFVDLVLHLFQLRLQLLDHPVLLLDLKLHSRKSETRLPNVKRHYFCKI